MKRALRYAALTLALASFAIAALAAVRAQERTRLLDGLIAEAVTARGLQDRQQIALSLANEIFLRTNRGLQRDEVDWLTRAEGLSLFNVTSVGALKYGGYGIEGHSAYGPCGTMTRVLLNALWRLEIPARKLHLHDNEAGHGGGHVMVEFEDGGRWLVLSASDSAFVWRGADGAIATAAEIQADSTLMAQIYERYPWWPYRFDNYSNIRWAKLPRPVTSVVRAVLGAKRFAAMETPHLYEQPSTLILYAALAGGVLFLGMAVVLRPRRPGSA